MPSDLKESYSGNACSACGQYFFGVDCRYAADRKYGDPYGCDDPPQWLQTDSSFTWGIEHRPEYDEVCSAPLCGNRFLNGVRRHSEHLNPGPDLIAGEPVGRKVN